MGAVMLTVQKANTQAMAFYTKLRYVHYGLVWFEDWETCLAQAAIPGRPILDAWGWIELPGQPSQDRAATKQALYIYLLAA
jgi:hypothetical protein